MIAIGRSHVGRVRSNNQDSFGIQMEGTYPHIIVADGMGGHKAGDVASNMAVNAVQEYIKEHIDSVSPEEMENCLTEAFTYANRVVYEHAKVVASQSGMGTTLVVSILHKDQFWIGHIGDSRGYLLQHGKLQQITEDHSLVNELVRNGQITPEEAEHHPQRHILTRALGTDEQIAIDSNECFWDIGDILVLCSDGLTIHVSGMEIEKILQSKLLLEEKVEKLLDLALARGGHDNITIVAVENAAGEPERGDTK